MAHHMCFFDQSGVGVTVEYPATLSLLLIRAGYAVHRENKFKMVGLAMQYAICRENKFKMAGFLSSWQRGMLYAVSNVCKRRSDSMTCVARLFRLMD